MSVLDDYANLAAENIDRERLGQWLHAGVEDKSLTAKAGFDHHLVKPVRNDELERILAR